MKNHTQRLSTCNLQARCRNYLLKDLVMGQSLHIVVTDQIEDTFHLLLLLNCKHSGGEHSNPKTSLIGENAPNRQYEMYKELGCRRLYLKWQIEM